MYMYSVLQAKSQMAFRYCTLSKVNIKNLALDKASQLVRVKSKIFCPYERWTYGSTYLPWVSYFEEPANKE